MTIQNILDKLAPSGRGVYVGAKYTLEHLKRDLQEHAADQAGKRGAVRRAHREWVLGL